MGIRLIQLTIFAVLSALLPLSTYANTLSVVTEESTLQYSKGNKVTGPATDLVKEVLKQAEMSGNFRIYPWPRAYKLAQTKPDVLIYSMARTPQREQLFKWVGEVVPLDYQFFRLKRKRDVNPKDFTETKSYRIGTIKDGAIHNFLKKNGFSSISAASNEGAYIKMFMAGRVDMIIVNKSSLRKRCAVFKIDCSLLEPVLPIPQISTGLYMAVSKQTDDATYKKLVNAYNKVKEHGTYAYIMRNELIQ
ncbi:MAG: substrate-binding periplasmic protein [Psychrobium sp.]